MTIEEYFGEWIRVIDKTELNKVMTKLKSMSNYTPSIDKIFKAFKVCNYNDLKIVMLGYDPYPQKGVATGILFGNNKEVNDKDLSPSLKIVKEASIDFEVPHNNIIFDQTLESWAKQGILMINSALTTEIGKTGSHTMLWRSFVSKLIKNISEYNTGIIYVLFGEQAKTFKPYIGRNNTVLEEKHPAYYARTESRMPSDIFYKVNNLIKSKYNTTIEWYKEN